MDQSAFLEAIAALQEPHPAEFWYWWSQIILTGLVFISAVVAACQLILIRRQARANFLLELDRRWEADDLWKTRVTIQESKAYIKELIRERHNQEPLRRQQEIFRELFADYLANLRQENYESYVCFSRTWGFLETLGLLVKKDYLTVAEIDALFGYSIIECDDMSRTHIERRDKQETENSGFKADLYIEARELAAKIRKRSSSDGASARHGVLRRVGTKLCGWK